MLQETKQNNIQDILNNDTCCGCGACAAICPVGAIKIIQDKQGFYKAEINTEKCISCGLCSRICAVKNNTFERDEKTEAYAVIADNETRLKSSSGGIFTLIANRILDLGGIVCGAAFDEDFTVRHTIIDNKNDLDRLRRSKYVQSYVNPDLHKEIKSQLESGRPVLFTGVPCQTAGLLNFLGKDYQNLYTIDLICAYAPPAKVFDKYLNESYDKSQIKSINFRSKNRNDWNGSIQNLEIETKTNNIIYDKNYMTPYLNRLFKGTHCENCRYKKLPRPADFTIGDYWRIDEFAPEMNDKKGTSALLLNTQKAKHLFETLKTDIKKLKKMPSESITWQIDVKNKITKTPACIDFFENLDKKSYLDNTKEAPKASNIGIINWWFVNNRGAILTNYALNEMVKSLGYNALTINYITPFERENFKNSFAQDFANKYIKRTRWIENLNKLKTLNNDIGTFLCGSDQIFRYFPCKAHDMIFYLDWADANKNKLISYSASFAVNEFEANEKETAIVRHFLKRFDNHSVRELDGVDIMKNTFGIECEQVLDPVFCIDKQKYIYMAEKAENKPTEDFIAYYIMRQTKENLDILEHVKSKLNIKKAINLNPPMSIENWLWYMQNAKFILTDSFHGTCFSLILNKEFAAIPNEEEYPSRFKTLEQLSGLSERFFYKNKDIYKSENILNQIDWSRSNETFKLEAIRSVNWLKNTLKSPKTHYLTPEQEMYDAIIGYCKDYTNRKLAAIQPVKRQKLNLIKVIQTIFCIKNIYKNAHKYKQITLLGINIRKRIY